MSKYGCLSGNKARLVGLVLLLICLVSSTALAKVTTIRYQDWRFTEEPSGSILRELVAKFEEGNPDIRVEIQGVPAAQRESAFITQFRAGDSPDVFRMVTTGVGSFVTMGALLPLDEFLSEGYLDQHADFLVKAGHWNNKTYSIPSEGGAFALYYNARLFEEAGLDPDQPPETLDELVEYAKKLTDPEKGQWGITLRGTNDAGTAVGLQTWTLANGVDFFNDDYSDTLLDSPEALEAFRTMIELYTVHGAVPPGPADAGYTENLTYFAHGQVAMMQQHEIGYGIMLTMNPDIAEDIRIARWPGPVNTSSGRGSVYGVSSQTRNAQAAWKLIEFLVSEESQKLFFSKASVYPSRNAILASELFKNDPIAAAFGEIMTNATSYPLWPEWPRAQTILSYAVQKALVGEGNPDDILREAADQIRGIIAESK